MKKGDWISFRRGDRVLYDEVIVTLRPMQVFFGEMIGEQQVETANNGRVLEKHIIETRAARERREGGTGDA